MITGTMCIKYIYIYIYIKITIVLGLESRVVTPMKAVSGAISKWSETQFSLKFSESTGVVRAKDSLCHLWKQFL